jgi:hypothetical protein
MKHTGAILLLLSVGWFISPPSAYDAAANPPEEIWKSLEQLPTVERERMKELQGLLGTSRVQLNTVEQNHKFYKDGLQILDEIVLKRKSSSM